MAPNQDDGGRARLRPFLIGDQNNLLRARLTKPK